MHSRLTRISGLLLAMTLGVAACGPGGGTDAGDGGVRPETGTGETGTEGGTDDGGMTEAGVMSVQITPMTASVGPGGMTRFTATATLTNMTTLDVTSMATWTSSDPSKATIDASGQATGVAAGTTMITAAFGGVTSAAATLTVEMPTLRSITLDPVTLSLMTGDSMARNVTARGTYSDGMTRDLNMEAGIMWTSSNPMVASVNAMGQVTAGSMAGTAQITAQLGGVTSAPCVVVVSQTSTIRSIAIEPSMASINAGETRRFTVTATFEDGRTGDVTSMATFTVDNMNVTFGMGADANLATGRMAGNAVVTATVGTGAAAKTATSMVTVNAATLRSIAIEPATAVIPAGTTQTFRAVGTFGDGSTRELTDGVMWSSMTPATATVSATGVVTGVAANATPVTITAAVTPMGATMPITGTATVLVTPATIRMLSATLEPTGNVAIGGRAQIRVQGTFSDMSSVDLTTTPGVSFMSSATATATVSSTGQVLGVAAGMATVTVSYMGQMATVPVTVAGTIVTGVDVTPAAPDQLPRGATQAFRATARLSDGTTRDITDDANVTFASSNAMIATISNAAGATRGVATGVAVGTTNITATYTPMGGMAVTSAAVPLAVIDAQVMAIDVTPRTSTTPAGFSVRFTATARLSDGTTRDLSQDSTVSWSSAMTGIATISNLGSTKGIATGVAAGSTMIVATYNSGRMGAMPITGSATLNVSAVTLASIDVTPDDVRVGVGTTRQYTATGVFSDGTTANITEDVNWAVVAGYTGGTISSLPGTRGVFTAGSMPVARRAGAIIATKTIGTSTVTGAAAVTVAGDFTLRSVRLRQGNLDLPIAGRNFVVPQGVTVQLRAFGTFGDGVTSEEREITSDAMATWNTSVPANVSVSNAMGTKGQITAVTRAAGSNAATSQISVTMGGFTSPVLTVVAGGANCAVANLSLTTSDASIPGATGNPEVQQPAYQNMALNNIGRGGNRSIFTWANFNNTGGCTNPAPINLTESGAVDYASSAAGNATVSNAAGTRGTVSVPTTATLTPSGGTGAVINARYGTLEANYQVVVTNACIQTLSISQLGGTRALPVGVAATFVVTGALADGTMVTTTDNSLPGNSVNVTATGLGMMGVGFDVLNGPQPTTGGLQWLPGTFLAANAGTSTVRAVVAAGGTFAACNAMMPPSATAMVTVNNATVTGVAINPAMATIAAGAFQDGFRVNATFSDMTTFDVTNVASWNSNRTLDISFPPFGPTVPVNRGSPARRIQVARTATGNGTATASFNQGGTIQSGSTNITFGGGTFSNVTAAAVLDTANCNQGGAGLGTYPVGADIRLQFSGPLTSGGGAMPIPAEQLTFTVSDPMRASIDATGLLSLNMAGSVTVTARLANGMMFTSPVITIANATLGSIATVPGNGFTISRGTQQQFSITGNFGGASTACPIRQGRGVMWSALPTTNPGWSIGAMTGLAAATATATPGAVTVIASYGGQMATTNGSITAGCIQSLELALPSGVTSTIASDETLILTPRAVYSDGTRQDLTSGMSYSTSNGFTATVANIGSGNTARGLVRAATPLMPGMVTITGAYSGGGLCTGLPPTLTATQAVTVSDKVLRTISISCTRPDPNSTVGDTINVGNRIVSGQQATCVASGTFSDGSVTTPLSGVTWTATGAGMINSTGGITAGATPGTLNIDATVGTVIGTSNISVVNGGTAVISILSNPRLPTTGAVQNINTGVVTRLIARATYMYTVGATPVTENYDVTEQSTWASSQPTRVDVSNAAGSKGRTTGGANPGQSNVTATFGTEMGTLVIDNSERVLQSINTVFTQAFNGASSTTITAGARQNVFVFGEYCPTGTMSGGAGCQWWEVTPIATLQVINTAVAALETTGTQPQARGVAGGMTAIRGTLGTFNDDATLTVNPACIQSISMSPTGINAVVAGAAGAESSGHIFTVTGTRSDGTTVVLTDPANGLAGNVFIENNGAIPGTWDNQIVAAEQFSARFPTAGMGNYRARFTGAMCTDATNTSANTSVLAAAGTLNSITVAPASGTGSVPAGTTQQYRATGNYTFAAGGTTTADITFNNNILWTSGNNTVASPVGSPLGLFRGNAMGTTQVNARLGNVTGSGNITVAMATLNRMFWRYVRQDLGNNANCNLNLTTGNIGSAAIGSGVWFVPSGGFKGRLIAIGRFSDNVDRDITSQVTFEMDNAYGSIDANGVVTTATTAPTGSQDTLITIRSAALPAAMNTITASLRLMTGAIQNVVLSSGSPANGTMPGPASATANLGIDLPLNVVGNFAANGGRPTQYCLTNSATFTSSDTTKATVSAAGVVTPVAMGNSTLTAAAGGRNDTMTVNVGNAVARFVRLAPATVSIAVNDVAQLTATAVFSDGTTQDVTMSGGGRVFYFATSGAANINLDAANGDFRGLAAGAAVVDVCYNPAGGANATCTGGLRASMADTSMVPAPMGGMGTRNYSSMITVM